MMFGRWRSRSVRHRVFAGRYAARAALVAAAVMGAIVPAAWVSPSEAASPTVVSITFDDGQATQYQAFAALRDHGMAGTFYINSGLVGSSGYYMTWSQLQELADAGNEIGGHTQNHRNLTQLSTSEAQREICDDRLLLQQHGFDPVSFAYPNAASNSTIEQLVQQCGYTNARTVGNLRGSQCGGCAYAESIPPRNPYYVRTAEPVVNSTTLAQLQSYVINAENNGGGWVPLVFHAVCASSCSATQSVSLQTFTAFLDWLQPRAAGGTVVKTMGAVMGGGAPGTDVTPPSTSILCNGTSCTDGWYGTTSVQVELRAADAGSGVASTTYTTDGTDPVTSSTALTYGGPFAVDQTTTVRFASTDTSGNREAARSQTIRLDSAAPSVVVTAPQDGAQITRGARVTLSAAASDTGSGTGSASSVASVAFRLDGTALGSDTTAPYQFAWNTRRVSLGSHVISAVATDGAGNRTTSQPVAVTIVR